MERPATLKRSRRPPSYPPMLYRREVRNFLIEVKSLPYNEETILNAKNRFEIIKNTFQESMNEGYFNYSDYNNLYDNYKILKNRSIQQKNIYEYINGIQNYWEQREVNGKNVDIEIAGLEIENLEDRVKEAVWDWLNVYRTQAKKAYVILNNISTQLYNLLPHPPSITSRPSIERRSYW
jgi:hypothetical protein